MKKQFLLSILVGAVLGAAAAGAQEPPVNSSDPNEIFNSMMQTMPDAMKNRVDSASTVQRSHKENAATTTPSPVGKAVMPVMTDAKQASLDELPEAVREQVRKTMQELEMENNQRMLQFKEMQNRKDSK